MRVLRTEDSHRLGKEIASERPIGGRGHGVPAAVVRSVNVTRKEPTCVTPGISVR